MTDRERETMTNTLTTEQNALLSDLIEYHPTRTYCGFTKGSLDVIEANCKAAQAEGRIVGYRRNAHNVSILFYNAEQTTLREPQVRVVAHAAVIAA